MKHVIASPISNVLSTMRRRLPFILRPRLPVRALVLLGLLCTACQEPPAPSLPAEAFAAQTAVAAPTAADSSFARLVADLSEQGAYFDTDNLISNERSYLHVLGALRERGLSGGAYLGVGPDQNFSYIALLRPEIAFLVDIRRDNLLEHVLFKALFSLARTRVEYLCLLVGKAAPEDGRAYADSPVEDLVALVDAVPEDADVALATLARVRAAAAEVGLPLTDADVGVVERFHRRFIREGLDLRFNSHDRPPQSYYPTLRQLVLETDRAGRPGSFLATEEAFQFLKRMQADDRIIPVVGDLAGDHALQAIAAYLNQQGLAVSALYTSNVEFYLMRQSRFDDFADNVAALPWHERGVLIRSYFNRWTSAHPATVPGYASTQLLQSTRRFLETYAAGGYASYWDLINEYEPALR